MSAKVFARDLPDNDTDPLLSIWDNAATIVRRVTIWTNVNRSLPAADYRAIVFNAPDLSALLYDGEHECWLGQRETLIPYVALLQAFNQCPDSPDALDRLLAETALDILRTASRTARHRRERGHLSAMSDIIERALTRLIRWHDRAAGQ